MTPTDVIESLQYHILQIESNYEDAYNMGLDLSITKKSFLNKMLIWGYYKENFPEDFGEYDDGYLDYHMNSREDVEESECEDDEKEDD